MAYHKVSRVRGQIWWCGAACLGSVKQHKPVVVLLLRLKQSKPVMLLAFMVLLLRLLLTAVTDTPIIQFTVLRLPLWCALWLMLYTWVLLRTHKLTGALLKLFHQLKVISYTTEV